MSLFEESMRLGEILQELCLNPLSMGAIAVARNLGVIRTRVERFVRGSNGFQRASPALRLARAFNTAPAY